MMRWWRKSASVQVHDAKAVCDVPDLPRDYEMERKIKDRERLIREEERKANQASLDIRIRLMASVIDEVVDGGRRK